MENNDGRLRLVLTNDSHQQFRGSCRISLGSEGNQKEIGQVELALPPQATTILQLNNITPSGQQYTLAIHDQKGARRFFKMAPLRQTADPTPAIAVAVIPIQTLPPRTNTTLLAASNSSSSIKAENDSDETTQAAAPIQVRARLLANGDAADTFLLSFEFRSARPVNGAKIAIVAGKIKDEKRVNIPQSLQSQLDFKLPEQLEAEQISYTLTGKDGRVLAKGELDLQQLMSDGIVTVSDIRTDRSSYEPGESAQITILLQGKSSHGYRLEVSAKDGQTQTIFRDQKVIGAEDKADSLEFTIAIPNNVSAPVFIEFKIFDAETGLLFDSGEREIMTNNTKSPRRP